MGGGDRVAFFGLLLALLAIRGLFGWKAQRSGHGFSFTDDEDARQAEGKSAAPFVAVLLGMVGLLVLYAIRPEGASWLYAPLPGWLQWFGVSLGLIALDVQVWVHYTLQAHWSTQADSGAGNVLITDGPYRWVRHPMYAGLMLLFIALALVSAFWPFLLLGALSVPMFHHTAGKEEALMAGRFGDVYRDYMKRTGRFLP
jgi:protein-S-isoprenylcysteine O-methyltransferase Ste14